MNLETSNPPPQSMLNWKAGKSLVSNQAFGSGSRQDRAQYPGTMANHNNTILNPILESEFIFWC